MILCSMLTFTLNEARIEELKNGVQCDCDVADFKPMNLFVLPGGGVSAIFYSMGIFKSLNTAGLLVDKNGAFNRDNVFVSSSGSAVTAFLILTCIHLKFHLEPNWFEVYVENSISKILPLTVIDVYVTSQVRSFLTEKLDNCFMDEWTYNRINSVVFNLLPSVFQRKEGFNFINDELRHYFKFNYVKVMNNIPFMTDNHMDLTEMTVSEQFKNIFTTCCTVNGLSYTRFFPNHDSGIFISNFINCITSYLDNSYIRNFLYYTLVSYDEHTHNKIAFRNTLNVSGRNELESNYFLITSMQTECKKKMKNFHLISPPNKFNTVLKFDVSLYTELQQKIYYNLDFMFYPERFVANYFFRSNDDMRKLVVLFGYYETLNAIKNINSFNLSQRSAINVEQLSQYVYTFDTLSRKYSLSKKDGTSLIKYDGCFIKLFDDASAELDELLVSCYGKDVVTTPFSRYEYKMKLIDFILFMQKPGNVGLTLEEIFPVQFGTNKKIWTKPEKCLSKEYRRVSKNAASIYFPSLLQKLKNVFS